MKGGVKMPIVHQKNKKTGITYVYESEAYWDKEKQQSRSRRKCIGKLDPVTGKLVPSKKHLAEKELETFKKRAPGVLPSVESNRLFYGAIYLFDQISNKLGITSDLTDYFPATAKKIMSVAYYLLLEDRNPMSRFSKWAKTHVHPYGQDLSSQRSSELFAALDENSKQEFFRMQGSRRQENEYLVYDTTSLSSYSKLLKQVKWGKNRDDDILAQINLALIYGQQARLPIYYRKLPGNISDVPTVSKLLKDIDFLDLDKVTLIMDRGFFSEANINALYEKRYKFLMGVRTGLLFIQKVLEPVRESMKSRTTYSSEAGVHFYTEMISWRYRETKKRRGEIVNSERRMYLHLYYNPQRAVDDQISFHKLLDQLEAELLSGKRATAHEKLYEKYYVIKSTPKRGIQLKPKQQVMDEAQKNYGYFALISNKEKDPLQALQIYRSKDIIEKAFGNLKERLNMRRTSVSSEENLDGKLFVQFIALMILAYIDKAMRDHSLYKNFTLQGLIDELDIIERYERPGEKPHIGEMTKKQLMIYDTMGVAPPE